jgi:hypothetical protein
MTYPLATGPFITGPASPPSGTGEKAVVRTVTTVAVQTGVGQA